MNTADRAIHTGSFDLQHATRANRRRVIASIVASTVAAQSI
jgi:hypothetical protein